MAKDIVFKKRLLKLVKLLKTVKRSKFNFETWAGNDWKGKADLSCGTTACALGWATTIPSLRKHGLRLFKGESHGETVNFVGLLGEDKDPYSAPERAAAKIFGLTEDEFTYLFTAEGNLKESDYPGKSKSSNREDDYLYSPDWDAGPKDLARHIKDFVRLKYPKQ